MKKHLDLEEIRERSVVDEKTGCWIWTGPVNKDGYGQVTYCYPNGRRRSYRTHRLAFEASHGRSVYPGCCVCHSCDNAACNNPAHLFEGSFKDNYNDMVAKGRKPEGLSSIGGRAGVQRNWFGRTPGSDMAGEASPCAKLSLTQVREIRRLRRDERWTLMRLAAAFGTSYTNVRAIVSGKSWKDES